LNSGEREVRESGHNDGYGDAETKISAGGGHGLRVFRALCRVKERSFRLGFCFKLLVSSCEFRVPSCEVSRFRFQIEVSSFEFQVSSFRFRVLLSDENERAGGPATKREPSAEALGNRSTVT
jgi:hypothetical protein